MPKELTRKHVHGLIAISLSLGSVDPVTTAYLSELGLIYHRGGQVGVTLKGQTLVGSLVTTATQSLGIDNAVPPVQLCP